MRSNQPLRAAMALRFTFQCAFALGLMGLFCSGFFASLRPAHAGEIFICNDGRTIELTPTNRIKFKDDPCVAEWFKGNQGAVAAEQAKTKEPPKSMKGIPAHCKQRWDCPHLW